jgi:hypothetical protein
MNVLGPVCLIDIEKTDSLLCSAFWVLATSTHSPLTTNKQYQDYLRASELDELEIPHKFI